MQNITSPPQANAEVAINENFVSVDPAALYGIRQPATTGLTFAYYGGIFNGLTIPNGTVTLTDSATNYVVAKRSDGVVSAATSTTNWNNSTDYVRLGIGVAASGTFTWTDHRQSYGFPPAGAGSGDVVGPGSSVDNTLPRFNTTTGKLIQGSGVTVSDDDEISGYKGNINTQTGTSYTLVAADSGKIVELSNAGAIALTADPALPKGFACTIVQAAAGQVTIASSGSGSVVNRQSQFKTAGQNAMCAVYVRSNSGSNAVFVFGGDTAA